MFVKKIKDLNFTLEMLDKLYIKITILNDNENIIDFYFEITREIKEIKEIYELFDYLYHNNNIINYELNNIHNYSSIINKLLKNNYNRRDKFFDITNKNQLGNIRTIEYVINYDLFNEYINRKENKIKKNIEYLQNLINSTDIKQVL